MRWIINFGILFILCACQKEEVSIYFDITNFSIESEKTNTEFNIQLAQPKNMLPNEETQIIFLLDANWYFDQVLRYLYQNKDEINSGFVLIGIETDKNRETDLTPTQTSQGKGGAKKFVEFIQEELIPETNNMLNINIERQNTSIIGHSLGGLFVTYAFTNHTALFKNYCALSPANWYDDGITLHFEEINREQIAQFESLFFLSVAEMEQTQIFNHKLYEILKENYNNVNSKFETIKRKNHSSGAKQSFERAIDFLILNF